MKKCIPATFGARRVTPAISVMLSAEVLVAMIACGRRELVDLLHQRQLEVDPLRRRLDDEVACPASASARLVVTDSRARIASASAVVTLPSSTPLEMTPSMAARPLLTAASDDVVHAGLEAAGNRRVRDAVPHGAGAEHRDVRIFISS